MPGYKAKLEEQVLPPAEHEIQTYWLKASKISMLQLIGIILNPFEKLKFTFVNRTSLKLERESQEYVGKSFHLNTLKQLKGLSNYS